MEQIVLNQNLKYIITSLDLEQRGKLLNALLGANNDALEDVVEDIYKYIYSLQQDILAKKKKMKEIGAKGNEAKKAKKSIIENATPNLFTQSKTVVSSKNITPTQCELKRKEAKENNNININNIYNTTSQNLSINPPNLETVQQFITQNNLNVCAEDFIDFYESRDWYVGKTAIRNWQATARMWDRRTNPHTKSNDEEYWGEISQKISIEDKNNHDEILQDTSSTNNPKKENMPEQADNINIDSNNLSSPKAQERLQRTFLKQIKQVSITDNDSMLGEETHGK